jgi:F-type H+-transporting ATPase subunit gamma
MATSPPPIEHPRMKLNSCGRLVILAIGSTRGLCGGYNNAVYRIVEVHVKMAKQLGKKLDVLVPEGKLATILSYHGIKPAKVYTDFGEMPTDEQLAEISEQLVSQYMAGRLDYLGVVYMRFHSVTGQQAQTLTIMPFTELIEDLVTQRRAIWPWELTFDDFLMSPGPGQIIEALAKMTIHSSIKRCFMDAALSEHLARMVAMRNATENAQDMIKQLTADYNRARQTQITRELLDIIGGTGVLE